MQPVVSQNSDQGIVRLISVRSHKFMEIDHEIISTTIRFGVLIPGYKRNYV